MKITGSHAKNSCSSHLRAPGEAAITVAKKSTGLIEEEELWP